MHPDPASPNARPVAVDLFAGAGGLSLGLEQAGFDVAAAVEYDPVHAATHEYNFPMTAVLCADIAAPLEAGSVLDAAKRGLLAHGRTDWDGELDLVAGGPPCQGFSLIGRRLVDDTRNELIFHFYRLVTSLRPKYFVMENVPGMATGGHASLLKELIAEFESTGYRFPEGQKYRILNAADYGVPQDRRRLFLIGTRDDQDATAVHPMPTVRARPKRSNGKAKEGLLLDPDLPLGPSVLDAIDDLPDLDDERFSPALNSGVGEIKLAAKDRARMQKTSSQYARYLHGTDRDPDDYSHPRNYDGTRLSGYARTKHSDESKERFESTPNGTTEPISRFYKLDGDGLSNTLRAGSGSERGAFTSPRPLHPSKPRVLSNREAARLHSFPDWFNLHATKWHGFRQVGNAVAPLLGRQVGRSVIHALGRTPEDLVSDESWELGNAELLRLPMAAAASHFGVSENAIPAKRSRGAVAGQANL